MLHEYENDFYKFHEINIWKWMGGLSSWIEGGDVWEILRLKQQIHISNFLFRRI